MAHLVQRKLYVCIMLQLEESVKFVNFAVIFLTTLEVIIQPWQPIMLNASPIRSFRDLLPINQLSISLARVGSYQSTAPRTF